MRAGRLVRVNVVCGGYRLHKETHNCENHKAQTPGCIMNTLAVYTFGPVCTWFSGCLTPSCSSFEITPSPSCFPSVWCTESRALVPRPAHNNRNRHAVNLPKPKTTSTHVPRMSATIKQRP